MELAKTYDPKGLEDRLYQKWLDGGYFHAEVNPDKKPFTIVMPPPNITGQLHMGHALDNTLQDILIRWKRMQGFEALWQPGTDHAAIATEVKVTEYLREQGIDKNEIGREEFLKHCWAWRADYGKRIINQLHKLGSSADWERERFTMDEGCSDAVLEVFMRLYEKGYIYKGSKIINWCPVCGTTISDAEVEHVDQEGFFWHINYPVVGEEGRFVEIATTRPETLLGDTAVAVNPNDDRYKDIVGKMLELPLTGRQIPVITDEYVDMEFGTGCVKITPAHDPNDFEVGKHHGLAEITILNDDGTVNELGGKYAGMDRYEARAKMVEDLKELGLLVKVVPHTHAVGTHDRCGTTIEPMVKQQWFVAMEEMAKPAIEAIKNGDLTFVPERFDKIYLHWLENIRDWCISRQLWWGHRIPAYYCGGCKKTIVSKKAPTVCPDCGGTHLEQDPDTLDTWFSSALWPFSTLGWPKKTPEMEYFYPTDVLVTGYDIIFFWVIRMVFSGYEQTGKSPFHHVLIHGLVRDALGRKMSKSLGNVIDPNKVCDTLGADVIRLWVSSTDTSADVSIDDEILKRVGEAYRHLRNTMRFLLSVLNDYDAQKNAIPVEELDAIDKLVLARACDVHAKVEEAYAQYRFNSVYRSIFEFTKELSNIYLDCIKDRMYCDASDSHLRRSSQTVAAEILSMLVRDLQPILAYTCDEVLEYMPESLKCGVEFAALLDWYKAPMDLKEAQGYLKTYETILEMRDAVKKALEDGEISSSMEASVDLGAPQEILSILKESGVDTAELCIVSSLTYHEAQDFECSVYPATGEKCPRCRNIRTLQSDGLCCRCSEAVKLVRRG